MKYSVCSCDKILIADVWQNVGLGVVEELRAMESVIVIDTLCDECSIIHLETQEVSRETEMGKGVV